MSDDFSWLPADAVQGPQGSPSPQSVMPVVPQPPQQPGQPLQLEVHPFQQQQGQPTLPSEADALYGRVRQAEGTAGGSGYVLYGGIPFIPGKDFPQWGGAAGPQGRTHAAGPAQWQPDTWNGLKPEFQQRFGRDPDFSSEADQKAMTWLNAAKIYPGGEAKLEADLKAGKLDTAALSSQWAGFKSGGGSARMPWDANITKAPGVGIADTALAEAQKHGKTAFMADPNAILALLPDVKEGEGGERKRSSLEKSLGNGEAIQDLPEITGEMQPDGSLKLTSYDGRHRLEKLAEAGYTKIPVVVQGAKGSPSSVVGMSGVTLPFAQNFLPTPEQQAAATQAHEAGIMDRLAEGYARSAGELYGAPGEEIGPLYAGAARMPLGAAQLATHGAAALGMPGAQTAAGMADRAAQGMEDYIAAQPGGPAMAAVGDIAGTLALPELRGANALARVARPIATGALVGATQPVTNVPQQGYFPQVGVNTLIGAATGIIPAAVSAGRNALRYIGQHTVGAGDVTRAVSRLFGENTNNITPSMMKGIKDKTSNMFKSVENSNAMRFTSNLAARLINIHREALDLGNAGHRVIRGLEDIFAAMGKAVPRHLDTELWLSGARRDVIPAGKASILWHDGGVIDNIINSRNPDVSLLGKEIKSSLLKEFSSQLPADQAKIHSAARNAWRDMKIVDKAYRSKPGGGTIPVRPFASEIGRRYPLSYGNNIPQIGKIGRAADEVFPSGRRFENMLPITGAVVGSHVGGLIGLLSGHMAGRVAERLALDRLGQLRFARGNALATLKPPVPQTATPNMLSRIGAAVPNMLGPLTAPAATALTMPGATF